MIGIPVQIVRWVDDYQPGIVECSLIDAHGKRWRFIEKCPVVTSSDLGPASQFPQPGSIACEVREIVGKIAVVDTASPWGVESTDGKTIFEVFADTLVERERTTG